jgi:hypothetical protein
LRASLGLSPLFEDPISFEPLTVREPPLVFVPLVKDTDFSHAFPLVGPPFWKRMSQ